MWLWRFEDRRWKERTDGMGYVGLITCNAWKCWEKRYIEKWEKGLMNGVVE